MVDHDPQTYFHRMRDFLNSVGREPEPVGDGAPTTPLVVRGGSGAKPARLQPMRAEGVDSRTIDYSVSGESRHTATALPCAPSDSGGGTP